MLRIGERTLTLGMVQRPSERRTEALNDVLEGVSYILQRLRWNTFTHLKGTIMFTKIIKRIQDFAIVILVLLDPRKWRIIRKLIKLLFLIESLGLDIGEGFDALNADVDAMTKMLGREITRNEFEELIDEAIRIMIRTRDDRNTM